MLDALANKLILNNKNMHIVILDSTPITTEKFGLTPKLMLNYA
ncbi:MAG TPA: hypothetical protein VFI61_03930 [Patescibacteria group bacterium]|nr:hypothetical protein [Patescibacteria group bacterium]